MVLGYRTILTVLGVNDPEDDLNNAIVTAQAVDAHLSVVVIAIPAPPPFGASAEMISAVRLEERQGDMAKLTERTKQVEEQLASSGLSFDVQDLYTESAWADEEIAERALYVDLTLIGRRVARDGELCRRIVSGILFQAPAPLLLNFTDQATDLKPCSVMVAWNSRIEAARAVQQALPILRQAREVRLILVDPPAKASVARQGVTVTAETVAGGTRPVGDILKQRAREIGADLIVMGAYGHSRLREKFLGGVTRSMIETADRPLFLSH